MDEKKEKDLAMGDTGDGFFDDAPSFEGENPDNMQKKQNPPYAPIPQRPYKKKEKSIWKILGVISMVAVIFFCGMLTTWLCLDKEIRTLVKVKRVIDKEYYQDISDDDFYRVIFSAINDDLLDPYSKYMTDDEYYAMENNSAGARSDCGVKFSILLKESGQQVMVYRVAENSPAEVAGLQVGDQIVGFGLDEENITYSDDYENGLKPFMASIEDSQPFVFMIKRGDGESFSVQLSKGNYVESYVQYRTNKTSYGFTGDGALTYVEKGKALSCLADDTAYIKLSQFTGNAAVGMDYVMAQFKTDGMKNLVLDLRNNGGGYVEYVQYIARYFCKEAKQGNPVMAIADYGKSQEQYYAGGNVYSDYFAQDSRIVVLADNGTASASESLIGCMLDYNTIEYSDICLAERSGVAKTYGKGIMQTTFYLDMFKKDLIKLTVAELKWPVSGLSIHARGILPEDGTQTVAEHYNIERETENAIALLFS